MKKLRKFIAGLFSMKTALGILAVLLAACLAGSLLPQGGSEKIYIEQFGENVGKAILTLKLNDVFHSWWFIAAAAFLCVNLLGCNLLRFPHLWRQTKAGCTLEKRAMALMAEESVEFTGDADHLFDAMGFSHPERRKTTDEEEQIYGVKNRVGIWGAWLTHLGLFLIILGFSLGQIFLEKESVYGVPGQTKNIRGTEFSLTIDSFETILREDETVEQYVSRVTLTNMSTGETQSGEISVNHPLKLFGRKLYQNTTGWASEVTLYKGDDPELTATLCAGEDMTSVSLPKLQLLFSAFYPDYVIGADGLPATASSSMNNPAYLYTLFYDGQPIGRNVLKKGEYISVDDYSFVFGEPKQYTLIQLKRDPFTFPVLLGGIILSAALVFAFYIRTEELFAAGIPGKKGTWRVAAFSRKGGILFKEKLAGKIAEIQGEKEK